ncbi:MAG: hypothetical protein ACI4TC_05515 [Kiritimatiellia bacterium]
MQIHQLALSVTINELRDGLRAGLEKAKASGQGAGQLDGFTDPDVKVKDGALVFSVKKKMGFIPVSLSASVTPKALTDGQGISLTLNKVNAAGILGGATAAGALMQQLAAAVAGRPGLSVVGNDLVITKDALTALPNFAITGAIKALDVFSDQIALTIG